MAYKVYGVTEVAHACHVTNHAVSNWIKRGKVPAPNQVLACGPIWFSPTIEPFIKSYIEHPSTGG